MPGYKAFARQNCPLPFLTELTCPLQGPFRVQKNHAGDSTHQMQDIIRTLYCIKE